MMLPSDNVDIVVVGAGPVGLASALLAHRAGLTVRIFDKSDAPLKIGRADAMNARTLQLLQLLDIETETGIFDELHAKGLHCSTSSVWKNGRFTSRQNTWWKALQGSEHKHFLMLGQPHLEEILNRKLNEAGRPVERSVNVSKVGVSDDPSATHPTWVRFTSATGEELTIRSKYLIGADGVHSFVRKSFPVVKFDSVGSDTDMTWAVLDGDVETTFPRHAEITNFQVDTNDVARIPREGTIDRYYVRMESKTFTPDEAIAKIVRAVHPHPFRFTNLEWNSQFTVRERLASSFIVKNRVFLAGDACHVHSVNGGQGLNTGLADAFNLIWKLKLVNDGVASPSLLQTYEVERRPVARTVIETAGALVRATQYAKVIEKQKAAGMELDANEQWDHANEYVRLVQLNSRFITGMGISYASESDLQTRHVSPELKSPLVGYRGFDFWLTPHDDITATSRRLYSEITYSGVFTMLLFLLNPQPKLIEATLSAIPASFKPVVQVKVILPDSFTGTTDGARVYRDTPEESSEIGATSGRELYGQALGVDNDSRQSLVVVLRPDSYVGFATPVTESSESITEDLTSYFTQSLAA